MMTGFEILKAVPILYKFYEVLKKVFKRPTDPQMPNQQGHTAQYIRKHTSIFYLVEVLRISPEENLFIYFKSIAEELSRNKISDTELIIDGRGLKVVNSSTDKQLLAFVDWAAQNHTVQITFFRPENEKFDKLIRDCQTKINEAKHLGYADVAIRIKK